MDNDSDKWLDELKPGDSVFVTSSYGTCATMKKVSRITKSAIFVAAGGKHESRYNKQGCSVPRDAWYNTYLLPVTAERIAAERLERKRARILKWRAEAEISALPEETCDAILAIIDQKQEGK